MLISVTDERCLDVLSMETEQLISEVEKRPVLWDTSDTDYKDRNKKNEAWLNVTSALYENFSNNTETEKKVIIQEVISKWRSVRDNYTRSLKKQTECNKSGSGVKKIQRYIFEQQLSFLKKCREQRPTRSSIQIHEQTNEDTPRSDFDDIESNIINNTQCSENEGNQNDTSISPCHKFTPAKKRKTAHSLEDK
ncbi:Uncharacterized protein FWK35_00026634 [Aphis craccivora]|uniref:MADF domain-containing protein n=1 Tax=Aphis craccivora TaxID=307492 RepID=A0A6G0W434_APHCR|nr:Uncharacterized protein FWK35_00026634 [Aphis craccivora]